MINTEDQEALFRLISDYISKDIECIAIGGTAMLFFNYKTATKDIDLVFKNKEDRHIFIKAIETLGYSPTSTRLVYGHKLLQKKNKPLMFTRGEERFDLFVDDVFGFKIDFQSRYIAQKRDFIGKKELIIFILSKEHIVLLKSITNRDKDIEDIETVLRAEPSMDWESIINLAIKQRKSNQWILIGLEEKMQKLKKITFIKKKYFDMIYKEEKKYKK